MAVVTTTHQELQVQVSTSKGNDTAVNLPLGHGATGGLPAQAEADTKLQLVSAQRVAVEQAAEPVSV